LCKAAKDTEISTKVVNWVSEKLLGKPEPESIIDKGALEKVSIKSLLPEKEIDAHLIDKRILNSKQPNRKEVQALYQEDFIQGSLF
jgi:hypothetical protein